MRKRPLRAEEEWARAMIQQALGVPVEQHDDGSLPAGMHDLNVLYDNGPAAAVEVTAAVDSAATESWNLLNGRGERWQEPGLQGGWMIRVDPTASVKRLRAELPKLLMLLEQLEIRRIFPDRGLEGPLDTLALGLGVIYASQSENGTSFPGIIYVTPYLSPEHSVGWVAPASTSLAVWLSEFLQAAERRDVLGKLNRSGAAERHVFVIVPGLPDAPFSVSDLLMRTDPPMPFESPRLPPEVTHIWAVSTWTIGVGFRWSPDRGWATFDKVFETQGAAAT